MLEKEFQLKPQYFMKGPIEHNQLDLLRASLLKESGSFLLNLQTELRPKVLIWCKTLF